MSTIKGIFEPFYEYVTTQLNLRKHIVGNGSKGTSMSDSEADMVQDSANKPQGRIDYTATDAPEEGEWQINGQHAVFDYDTVTIVEKNNERGRLFHAYTTQKQCTIQMASGVNIKQDNDLLDEYESHWTGDGLARNWVLESGVKGRFGGQRSGFSDGTFSTMEGEAYGDASTRSDAADGFGIVPMPGIIDATIDTKSEEGSLREAKVNFTCFNRRQLEVLEALYMRPGYPILLEWGWTPYLSNDTGEGLSSTLPSILDEFMRPNENLNSLNDQISKYKEATGGNYDGFIGYCKNFSFKVREDGGYDCITEIIAHGEILESLRTPITLAPKVLTAADTKHLQDIEAGKKPKEYESIDRFLFYLRAIKTNLDSAGDQVHLNFLATDRMRKFDFKISSTTMGGFHQNKDINYGTTKNPIYIGSTVSQEDADAQAALVATNLVANTTSGIPYTYTSTISARGVTVTEEYVTFYGYLTEGAEDSGDNNENLIPLHQLNEIHTLYADGYEDIKDLVADVSKVSKKDLNAQAEKYTSTLIKTDDEYLEAKSGERATKYLGLMDVSLEEHVEWARGDVRWLSTAGLDPILEGTIIKEVSVQDESLNDSGIRKKIFVRWDLICQILNQLVTPQYKKDHALVELTYLNPNQPTFKAGDNPNPSNKNNAKWGLENNNYYLDYSQSKSKYSRRGIMTNDKVYSKYGDKEDLTMREIRRIDWNENDLNRINIRTLGQSFDTNVCLMPHQIQKMLKTEGGADKNFLALNPFTSFDSTTSSDSSIGMVYFNLDYLIQNYEKLALETFKTDVDGVSQIQRKLKNKFSFHDFITTIWDGVNEACGGYYNFGLHTEHSRPHIARVIDFTFSGNKNDLERQIFQFDPQGLGSISRESSYQSKLDNDFANIISIAAQSPSEIDTLEAMSFKAFHKNIKNRFTTIENEQKEIDDFHTDMERRYKNDVKLYNNALLSLNYYIEKMNFSNYETELLDEEEGRYRKPMSPSVAKDMASRLEEMKNSIDSRYGEIENGVRSNNSTMDNPDPTAPWVGTFRENTTYNRSAIIPITVSMTIDGISGIHPLQIFKINPRKLPLGYQNPNIVFVTKKETQTITSGQDWTTKLEGHLTLLNTNENNSTNQEEFLNSKTEKNKNKLDDLPPPSPNADKLREVIASLSTNTFKITEKQAATAIADNFPQLSSNGDITPELVDESTQIFNAMAEEFKGLSITVQITGGNDVYHAKKKPNSKHVTGKAIDFTIYPYNPQVKDSVEKILTNNPNTLFINEYETITEQTGKHFHYHLLS